MEIAQCELFAQTSTQLFTADNRAFTVAAAHLWNSLLSHATATPISASSCVVLNHISSHFLIPLPDTSLSCTVPMQWLIILDSIIIIM